MMKWIVLLIWFVLYTVGNAFPAEYTVQSGDTIGIISQKTGCSVEHLAQLNEIKPPKYIVRKGQVLSYPSEQDFKDALKTVDVFLYCMYPGHPDYNQFLRLREAIVSREVNYSGYLSPHADEVILFAQLYRDVQNNWLGDFE